AISLINPYQAIRSLSMGMAGSDFYHYVDFLNQAEEYRYGLVQWLNGLQTTKLKYGQKDFRLPKDTWREYPSFTYKAPSFAEIFRKQFLPLISLVGWTLILASFGLRLVKRKEEI